MKLKLFLTYLLIVSGISLTLAQDNTDTKTNTKENTKVEKIDNSQIQYKAITNKKEYLLEQEQKRQDQAKSKEEQKALPKKEDEGTKNEEDDL